MLPCGDFVVDRSGFRLQNPSKKKKVWDATSADPKLLVFLKSYKNTVPVPRHWCQKRKFLQGSGCDNHGALTCMCLANMTFKVSVVLRSNLFTFQLPDFIAATGIEKIRQIPFMIVIFCQDSECAFIDPVGR
ncbi:SPLICING FACTOR 3B SUBUNIT 2-LIKE [Salix purpurea]|uniref:SPLICING FACTOR 3B SUBUNIT 2-LIKE n=1 Tax=Salix purpurea TaxID=77065 RepID=A0A9Q0PQU5_SALPP|nr:SPLICING FACTOR 3B SUBUNIT 2-LIKE [Salix purpurea]